MYSFCGTNVGNCSKLAKSTNFKAYVRGRLPLNQGKEAPASDRPWDILHTTAQLADGAEEKWPSLHKTPPALARRPGGGGVYGRNSAE
jgi:hypothetical protein